ncbi:MAG: PAS domain S-box protein [Bacillota bacterium]
MIIESSVLEKVFLQSTIPQMIFEHDFRQNVVNAAFYEFIGYSKEEWSNLSVKDISHPEDYDLDFHLFHELIAGKRQSYQMEKRYFHKSGEIIWGKLYVTQINDPSAKKQYFLSQLLDITEEKNLERILTKSEQKYRLVAENSSDVINLHLKDGRFIYTSPSITQILGYDVDEVIGESPYVYIHPEDVPAVEKTHLTVLSNTDPKLITYRVRKKDGTYIWIETSIRSVIDEQTCKITGLISVSRDIRKRLETDILLRKSEKLAVVGQLAAAVAHEIRNPLTSVKGFIQLFSSTKQCNEEYMKIVLDELDRVEMIISEFLTMSRPHQEKMAPVKVDEIIRQVIQLLQTQALLINKQINYIVKSDIPFVYGDANSLKQVFFNIIQNALDAIDEKGTVIVRVSIVESTLCIHVIDNGCGIPEERLNNLGEPFYSTKEKGTGLGLMTSFKIIENHHGSIKIDSTVGKGTTVSISLPF